MDGIFANKKILMKSYLTALFIAFFSFCFGQPVVVRADKDQSWKKIYRGEALKINDLVNTKLDVRFDYDKSWMYGKAWITLKPHFYPTDSLNLDAKGMQINEVALIIGTKKTVLKYAYDGLNLKISLDKTYKNTDSYTVYIDYISKPDEFDAKGSAAITDAKGLYFINPKGTDKSLPTQIWTQGETESNSVWMPTIDKPNQKTTEEISMTVPSKYVTLSNGLLVNQKKNTDGTRTDTWRLDLPNAPYLFFMGVGDYSIVKDNYKGKEVSYYVEKEYEPVARKIFGNTPEMMKFYADKLGMDYQWPKYSQIVGRKYVSGAMENTTATLHQETANQNARQLLDGNKWEEVIAHELFHHWFGDLVTCESWSNLTVNESFADFSETLWDEYKYGKDAGDEHNYEAQQEYLMGTGATKDLVRFYYRDREDMFDEVTYQKGGRVLNMLRNYVGDEAFFKSLNKYLTDNKFKNGEAQQLRLAFESVTGQDLNWFWNEWYYSSGHPLLKIDYSYNDAAGEAKVIIKQTQKIDKTYKLPFTIDIYNGSEKKRYNVWMNNKSDTFTFAYSKRPDLINVDAQKILLCEKTDNKTADNYKAQIQYAPLYVDRREALEYFASHKIPELLLGLKDKYAGIRTFTLEKLGEDSAWLADENTISAIENLAKNDSDRKVRAKALEVLGFTGDDRYKDLFVANLYDSSYSIAGAALGGLYNLDTTAAFAAVKKLKHDTRGDLSSEVISILLDKANPEDFDFIAQAYNNMPFDESKIKSTVSFSNYLATLKNTSDVKKGVDEILQFRSIIPDSYKSFTDSFFNSALAKIAAAQKGEIEEYIMQALKK